MASPSDPIIGVGPALRKARERRGITVGEVSRDTKLGVDQIRALEDESFDEMLGEAHVRGALGTYSRYLGLDPDKVSRAYSRHAEDLEPPPPPAKMGTVERAIAAARIRDNQRFLQIAALAIIAVAIVFGLLSRSHGTPPPAALGTATPTPVPLDQQVQAVVVATEKLEMTVTADGTTSIWHMAKGESRTATAQQTLVLELARGVLAHIVVNGRDLGTPGRAGQPWHATFDAATTPWVTPSASASSHGSGGAGSPSASRSPAG
ncbi:MAG: helix-turn-helix transcriptional regulator [Actinomycetota bacterium]